MYNIEFSASENEQTILFMLPEYVNTDTVFKLYLKYTYKVRSVKDEALGLYRSTWIEDNKTHHIASTQFKSIHARKVVPCLDDPNYRAKWTLNIKAPLGYVVDANTPPSYIDKTTNTYKFQTSDELPSNAIGFVVHDQSRSEHTSPGGRDFSFIGPAEKLRTCNKTVKFTGEIIDLLADKFFNVTFPYKIDIIAVPRLYANATESPGLIALEMSEFCDPYSVQLMLRQLLHQWFANIATPQGWSNYFMTEGLVEYYWPRIIKELYPGAPDDRILYPGVIMSMQSTLLSKEPETVEEATNIVKNELIGLKAATLFNWMEYLIGPQNFDTAVNSYFSTYQDKWGNLSNFLGILDAQKYIDYNLNDVFTPYFTRSEYPVAFVKKTEDGFDVSVALAKDDSTFKDNSFVTYYVFGYYVPVWYRPSLDNYDSLLLLKIGETLNVKSPSDALFVNSFGHAYYRACYEPKAWIEVATNAVKDPVSRMNTKADFDVCTHYESSPYLEQARNIFDKVM